MTPRSAKALLRPSSNVRAKLQGKSSTISHHQGSDKPVLIGGLLENEEPEERASASWLLSQRGRPLLRYDSPFGAAYCIIIWQRKEVPPNALRLIGVCPHRRIGFGRVGPLFSDHKYSSPRDDET